MKLTIQAMFYNKIFLMQIEKILQSEKLSDPAPTLKKTNFSSENPIELPTRVHFLKPRKEKLK